MHSPAPELAALAVGDPIGPLEVTVSPDANERYWHNAGVDHPALASGALYPPIAANLTILAYLDACSEAVIQTRQRLVCHRRAEAGTPLVVRGSVTARYNKRGREYADIKVTVAAAAAPDAPIWTSEVSFTPTATLGP
jgi:hypothetical protein